MVTSQSWIFGIPFIWVNRIVFFLVYVAQVVYMNDAFTIACEKNASILPGEIINMWFWNILILEIIIGL